MIRKEHIKRSLELKFLIDEHGEYKDEIKNILGFLEAKIYKQLDIYDKKIRLIINKVLESAEGRNLAERDFFRLAEQEYRNEFAHWAEQGANRAEVGIRHIILDWSQR